MPPWHRFLDAREVRSEGDEPRCDCGAVAVLVAHGYAGRSQALYCGPCAHAVGVFGCVHGLHSYPEAA